MPRFSSKKNMRRKSNSLDRLKNRKKTPILVLDEKVKRIQASLRNEVAVNSKVFDMDQVVTHITSPTLYTINEIEIDPQNAESGELTKHKATSITVKFKIIPGPKSVTSYLMRTIIFWDRQSNGDELSAALGQSYLLDVSEPTIGGVYATRNMTFIDRFDVVYDKTVMIPGFRISDPSQTVALSTMYTGHVSKFINVYKKLSRNVYFELPSEKTEVTPTTNCLYMLVLSDAPSTTDAGPLIEGAYTYNYKSLTNTL